MKFFILIQFFLISISSFAINTVATGFRINNGLTVEIDAHGVCQNVTNSSGFDQFISTKTASEWTSFRANLPTNVTLGVCATNLTFAGATHNESDCTTGGGSVVTVTGAVTLCRFNSPTCPGGWAKGANWSTATSNSTTCNSAALTDSYTCAGSTATVSIPATSNTITANGHSWSNSSRDTEFFRYNPVFTTRLGSEAWCSFAPDTFTNDGVTTENLCGNTVTMTSGFSQYTWEMDDNGITRRYSREIRDTTGTISATITQIGCI